MINSMFITISEVIAIIAMTLGIGYIFSGYFRKPVDFDSDNYDPLKAIQSKNNVWENTKFAAMIAAPTIVFHEIAHKIAAVAFGAQATINAPYTMYAIVMILKAMGFPLLFFVGGYVSHTPLPPLESSIVSIAGPLTNFIIWGICILLVNKKLVKRKYYHILIPMSKLSLFLGIFNMIPIPGFDGYNFFSAIIQAFF